MLDTHYVTATEIKAHCPNARYAQFYFEDSGCGGEELSAALLQGLLKMKLSPGKLQIWE